MNGVTARNGVELMNSELATLFTRCTVVWYYSTEFGWCDCLCVYIPGEWCSEHEESRAPRERLPAPSETS